MAHRHQEVRADEEMGLAVDDLASNSSCAVFSTMKSESL